MSCDVCEATERVGGGSAHSPTLPSVHLRHSSFSSLSNPSVASPTSQLIIQPFYCFIYITAHYPTLPLLHLRTSQPTLLSLHLRHLVSHPWARSALEPNCRYATATRVVHISVYQTKERSEVVCQVLSSLSQWPYGNTFYCTHRHKSPANTTTKHPHTPNSSQTVTAINGTEPSWELQKFLQPKPVDKCYTTVSIIHGHRRLHI